MPTLAALVPAVPAGLLREVVIADAGSSDATGEVAEIAGCRFMSSAEPLGARLKAAAESTRAPWLLFLRAGCVPDPGWIAAAERFMQGAEMLEDAGRAAVFRPHSAADLMRPRLAELAVHPARRARRRAPARAGPADRAALLRDARRPCRQQRGRGGAAAQARPAAHRNAGGGSERAAVTRHSGPARLRGRPGMTIAIYLT